MNKLILILVGPPGSGKGTQALEISKLYNIPHISTGDMFRYHLKNLTDIGLEAKAYIDKGLLVPDTVTNKMVWARIQEKDCNNGFLLDGFPRNLMQADFFDKLLKDLKIRLNAVLYINVKDEVIVNRLSGRRVCNQCGYISHIDSMMVKGILLKTCNKCGGTFIQRVDDQIDVILDRLKVYHEQTKPIIAHYQKQKLVNEIDGDMEQTKVFKSIVEVINSR